MKRALVLLLCFSSFAFGQDVDSGNTSSQSGDLNTNQQGATGTIALFAREAS